MMVKSIRLSESKREDIITSVSKAWDEANPLPEILEKELHLANYYYEQCVDKKLLQVLETKKYEDYVNMSGSFLVQVKGIMRKLNLGKNRPVPCRGYQDVCIGVIDEEHPLEKEIKQIEIERDRLAREKAELRQQTRELLTTVSTTTQLLEIWPEIEDLLPAYLADPSKGVNLPSIPVSRLNQKLGLKKKEIANEND